MRVPNDRSTPVRAPELDAPGVAWLNVGDPPSLRSSRGRFALLDFWTLGCVNCVHVLPTLRRVEAAFADEVRVIGVHSPKFDAEREPERVRRAIARLGIGHPVLHDPDRRLWEAYAVRAWPTLVLVGPDGRIVDQIVGEPEPDAFLEGLAARIRGWRDRGDLRPALPPRVAPSEAGDGRFAFPAKIAPVPGPERRLALADAGGHRLVLLDGEGRERGRFGTGRAGFRDGDAAGAAFSAPQGVVAGEDALYVADTGNHAIRVIDRATGRTRTIAGTGTRGRIVRGPGVASDAALASPWDVALDGRRLYVANAGTHQLLAVDLDRDRIEPLAGVGAEGLRDGPAAEALLAQPSGLALDATGRRLWFVDAESSAVRVLALEGDREVGTLVGGGLFDWGRVDGPAERARLQHPVGLASHGEHLYVADAYNDAVRRVDLRSGEVADALAGFACRDRFCRPLAHPASVAFDAGGDRMYVVDRDRHRVLVADLASRTYRTWAA